jgi:hypothetical protein
VNTGLGSGEVVLSGGAGSFTKNGIAVPPDQAQSIIANPAAYYFNIHSTMNAGGVSRGQLGGSSGGGSGGNSGGNPNPY